MIKKQLATFVIRWFTSTVAMVICINLFGIFAEGAEDLRNSSWIYVLAGLIFSLVNSIVKPIATIFSLPLLFITLGVFTVILNAAMVALTILILPDISMTFWGAIGSCLVISFINFLVNLAVPDVK
jgi:putative membrane protein